MNKQLFIEIMENFKNQSDYDIKFSNNISNLFGCFSETYNNENLRKSLIKLL